MKKMKELSIAVTLPASIEWEDYQKELDMVKDGKQVMNFKVPFLPKKESRPLIKKCYLIWRGHIMGWQSVCGFVENSNFTCTTTDKQWNGNFIQRTGEFHKLDNPIDMMGFRGWKYIYI